MIQPCLDVFMPESNWRAPEEFPRFSEAKWISIDLETRDPHLRAKGPGFIRGDAYIAGVALHMDGFTGYWPVRHAVGQNLAPNVVFEWLRGEAKHFQGQMFGANLGYELEGLWHEDVHFRDDVQYCDVLLAEPLIAEESLDGFNLEAVSVKYLGYGKQEDLLREAASKFTKGYRDSRCRQPIPFDPKGDLWMLDPIFVGPYAEGDVVNPQKIFTEHQSKVFDEENLWNVFRLESSLVPLLLQMKVKGIAVDLEAAEKLCALMSGEIDKYSAKIKDIVGFEPNLDSGQEVLRAYETLNFKHPELNIVDRLKRTEKGNPSFVAEWYAQQTDPLSKNILKKKKLTTLREDFVRGDIMGGHVNGRLHTQFKQLRQDDGGTRGGRFASANPNLQAVPARHDEDLWGASSPIWAEEVRKLFVPDAINPHGTKRKLFCKSDISQQEPRLLLHFAYKCGLPGAVEAVETFRKNPRTDYHQMTTDIVNAKSGRNFKRKRIKSVNLAVMYSAGRKKLCQMTGISAAEGDEVLAAYHEALPFVRGLSSKAMAIVQSRGFITTLLGRRRRSDLWEPVAEYGEEKNFKRQGLPKKLAEQRWPDKRLQRYGVHRALNQLVQGSAGDQTKAAMRMLYYEHRIIPQLQVHDEVDGSVFDIEEARIYKYCMEHAVELALPVVCDTTVGSSWGAAKEPVN